MAKYEQARQGAFYNDHYGRIMYHEGRSTRIHWSPTMLHIMRQYYPQATNSEVAGMLGVSPRTVVRKAREMGLTKDRAWLTAIWDNARRMAWISNIGGNSTSFRKGEHASEATEFKPGNRLTKRQQDKRKASMEKFHLRNPTARKKWAAKGWETRRKNNRQSKNDKQ